MVVVVWVVGGWQRGCDKGPVLTFTRSRQVCNCVPLLSTFRMMQFCLHQPRFCSLYWSPFMTFLPLISFVISLSLYTGYIMRELDKGTGRMGATGGGRKKKGRE